MIGLVLVTHGRLAEEFRSALEHVVGPQKAIATISIGPDDDMDHRRQDILDAVAATDDGNGVIILTDMFGGTPSNIGLSFLDPSCVEVLTGVNLPMVLKFFNSQEDLPLAQLALMLKAYGQQSISLASELLQK